MFERSLGTYQHSAHTNTRHIPTLGTMKAATYDNDQPMDLSTGSRNQESQTSWALFNDFQTPKSISHQESAAAMTSVEAPDPPSKRSHREMISNSWQLASPPTAHSNQTNSDNTVSQLPTAVSEDRPRAPKKPRFDSPDPSNNNRLENIPIDFIRAELSSFKKSETENRTALQEKIQNPINFNTMLSAKLGHQKNTFEPKFTPGLQQKSAADIASTSRPARPLGDPKPSISPEELNFLYLMASRQEVNSSCYQSKLAPMSSSYLQSQFLPYFLFNYFPHIFYNKLKEEINTIENSTKPGHPSKFQESLFTNQVTYYNDQMICI